MEQTDMETGEAADGLPGDCSRVRKRSFKISTAESHGSAFTPMLVEGQAAVTGETLGKRTLWGF